MNFLKVFMYYFPCFIADDVADYLFGVFLFVQNVKSEKLSCKFHIQRIEDEKYGENSFVTI